MTTDNPFSYPSVIFTPILKGLTDTAIVFQYVVLGDDAEKSRKHHIETSVSPSLLWTSRLFFGGIAAGFVSGAGLQGHIRSRQFLAENAHRLPRTVGGWYFYHRHKQLAIISGAGVGGVYYAARFGLLSAMFGVAEHAIGEWVTGKDIFVNALGAGLFTAAAFSRIAGLSWQASQRAFKYGGACGLLIGLLEDAYSLLNGHSIKNPNLPELGWRAYLDGSRWFGKSESNE